MKSAQAVLLVAFLSILPGARGHDATVQEGASFERELRPPVRIPGEAGYGILERMEHYRVPGVSIAVIRDFRVALARGYGVKEAGRDDPVTPGTVFQAASISKPVTALAALKMVEDGELALDGEANAWLREWKIPTGASPAGDGVTLRQLLSHTSGLAPAGFNGYPPGYPIPTLRQVLDGESPANSPAVRPASPPGAGYRYSGAGYVVLQAVLMDAEGRPFDEIMEDEVFRPVGMEHSRFSQPRDRTRQPDAASGHLINGRPLPGGERVYPELAAAGLWTTPTDLARFLIDLQKSWREGSGVLSRAMAREMVTAASPEGMGLGLLAGTGPDGRTVEHGGLNEGFKARMVASLDGGYGAVVMTNGERGAELADEIIRGIAVTEGWADFLPRDVIPVTLDDADLRELTGRYSGGPLRLLTCVLKDGGLVAVEAWGEETALVPISRDDFLPVSGSPTVHFVRDDGGRVVSLELRSASSVERLARAGGGGPTAIERLMNGDSSGAAALLDSLRGAPTGTAGPAWARVDDLAYRVLRSGFPENAHVLFRFNAGTNPRNAVCQYGLADLYLKTGDLAGAREQFVHTIEVARDYPDVNASFAGILRRAEDQLSMLGRGR